jgi:hypothetical protein
MLTIGREIRGNKNWAVRVETRLWGIVWVALLPLWFAGGWFLANRAFGSPVARLSAYGAVVAFGCISGDFMRVVALINFGGLWGKEFVALGGGRCVQESGRRDMERVGIGRGRELDLSLASVKHGEDLFKCGCLVQWVSIHHGFNAVSQSLLDRSVLEVDLK